LVTEASAKRWPAGPWLPASTGAAAPGPVPPVRTTAAAAVGTGQFSIIRRLFMG
jgi:hypothetical protein